ncbi:MAG TPA: ABC transporter ATP-binding protein/permease [Clostridia bacterium]|nr:ABC transporter ATP-binding protein/permease [Clostridia bacterium]
MLKLNDIKKNYYVGDQTIQALKGLTVEFRQSEFVAVLGPSGCGKTTLMNIIGGLDQYTSGDLIINGRSTRDFNDYEWDNYRNKKIGFVFQSYNLIPHQTVIQNVELALTLSGITKEERRKRAIDALEKVGLADQIRKKPNQLSGGQMQRVAIARALVNSPDILLADEPTGALDTTTSSQIMDIIKEISKDRLVIMVTHNAEIANTYATRLIKMVDGLITEDSRPYDSASDPDFQERLKTEETPVKKRRERNKTSMSFFTALSLSLKNLNTKKARTILTSIAGSIGIIGIAMILAISSGINAYIDSVTVDALATNPITVSTTGFDINQAMNYMGTEETMEKFPAIQKIFVKKARDMSDIIKTNIIDDNYVNYIKENIKKEWVNDIRYGTSHMINIYGVRKDEATYSNLIRDDSGNSLRGFVEMGSTEFTDKQYQAIFGRLPENKNEIVIIVDEYNRIGEETLINLGYKTVDEEVTEYEFSDLMEKQFKILTNDLMYEKTTGSILNPETMELRTFEYFNEKTNKDFESAETLTIVGIVRLRPELEAGILSNGIGYTRELTEWVLEQNLSSELITWMNENPLARPMSKTGAKFIDIILGGTSLTAQDQWKAELRKYGGIITPDDIRIYPVDFKAKESIVAVLDAWNANHSEQIVTYTDIAEMLSSVLSEMVNYISYALIAFTAISLLVSSVMIGIITYVSVLERTKEIGILRAIGARKIDITRVFNAETFIIGLLAGLIGVVFTYIISVPINIIIYKLTEVKQLASLPVYQGLILILVSVALTVISGLIPAFKAAKKDPVTALRTE